MEIYGHPWSINTRKVLAVLAEKGHEAKLVLVMLPKGEHKSAAHLALHPFGKVPVLRDQRFVLYETQAINRYLERTLPGPSLVPADPLAAAHMDQWIGVVDAYFGPQAQALIVESLFRRYLGGETDVTVQQSARAGVQPALDAADRWLADRPYFAGEAFSLADIHWLPYVEYLTRTGAAEELTRRPHFAAWFQRASSRASWQQVARTGPQPDAPGMSSEVIEQQYR
jgi:glutathione S-transferase